VEEEQAMQALGRKGSPPPMITLTFHKLDILKHEVNSTTQCAALPRSQCCHGNYCQ
jgi:hypothetical protein